MATRFYGVSIIGIVLTDKDLRVSDETSGETVQTTNITHVLIHTHSQWGSANKLNGWSR